MLLHLSTGANPAAESVVGGGAHDLGCGIGRLDHGGIVAAEAEDGVVIGSVRENVAVRIAPTAGLVVELIVGDASADRVAEGQQQVSDPVLLELRAVIDVVAVYVFVDELGAARAVRVSRARDAVTAVVAVGMDIRIGGLLGP